jgi:hypothetical protein
MATLINRQCRVRLDGSGAISPFLWWHEPIPLAAASRKSNDLGWGGEGEGAKPGEEIATPGSDETMEGPGRHPFTQGRAILELPSSSQRLEADATGVGH